MSDPLLAEFLLCPTDGQLAEPPPTACPDDFQIAYAALRTLAERSYPGLRRSGLCSAHRDDGHYACTVCYPDYHALLTAHLEVSNKLHADLRALAGLTDPPAGRIGTNTILTELRRQLAKSSPLT